ncbi:MAG: thiol reductant ABC exporter subunit CydC [Dehalococcoidia bacterium]
MHALARIARLALPVRGALGLALLAGAGAAACGIAPTAISAWLVARAAEQPPILSLMVAITAVRAFGIGRGGLRYLERLLSHDAAFRVLAALRHSAYARLERLAPSGLEAFRSGDLLARLVLDVDGLADLWLRVLLPYAAAAITAVGVVAFLWHAVPAIGGTVVASLLLAAAGAPLVVNTLTRRAERRIAPAQGRLAALAHDLLAGAPELLALGATPRQLRRFADLDADLASAEGRAASGAGAATLLAGLASGGATWVALFLGVAAVRAGMLDGVGLTVVVLTTLVAHDLVLDLAPASQHLPGLSASAERVLRVLDGVETAHEPESPAALPVGPYGLRIRGLCVRYPASARDVIAGVDLDVAPGGRALVTGPSGSGKSTLAAVLLRFLDPSAGSIELAGSDATVALSSLAGEDVRRAIGLCEQDPHIFDTTLAENMSIARPGASADEVREALRAAQLLDWVDALPAGLDTPVGEHGARLSGGQRQRLGVARALLAGFPVIIFDEPTEHLDEREGAAIARDLLAATAGRTVLVLTHRPELAGAAVWSTSVDLAPRG